MSLQLTQQELFNKLDDMSKDLDELSKYNITDRERSELISISTYLEDKEELEERVMYIIKTLCPLIEEMRDRNSHSEDITLHE